MTKETGFRALVIGATICALGLGYAIAESQYTGLEGLEYLSAPIIAETESALIVWSNGAFDSYAMESERACVDLTRKLAPYVESANCASFADYIPPQD